MRAATLSVLLLAVAGPVTATQVDVGLQAGVVASTRLVRDSIVETFDVRQALAPRISAHFTAPLGTGWRVGARGAWSRSDLVAHESTGSRPLVGLTVWEAAVLLERPLTRQLHADASVGMLVYQPAFRRGTLFQNDTPRPLTWGVGLTLAVPLGRNLAADLRTRWDVHRFNTERLRAEGFRDPRFVHRFAVAIGLSRRHGAPQP